MRAAASDATNLDSEDHSMERKKASDFDSHLLSLFNKYVHGVISRREFLEGAGKVGTNG